MVRANIMGTNEVNDDSRRTHAKLPFCIYCTLIFGRAISTCSEIFLVFCDNS